MDNVFMYVSKEKYERVCKELKSGQTLQLYKDKDVEIDLKRIGSKIYKFISHYGKNDIDKCLEEMYLKKCKIAI